MAMIQKPWCWPPAGPGPRGFRQDVVVDITCFRKLGTTGRTLLLTQPLMYKKIAQHPGTRKLYADKLAAQGLGETSGR